MKLHYNRQLYLAESRSRRVTDPQEETGVNSTEDTTSEACDNEMTCSLYSLEFVHGARPGNIQRFAVEEFNIV